MGIKTEVGKCVFCGAAVKCEHHNCVCEKCAEERGIGRLDNMRW